MDRVLEPEIMDGDAEAAAYARADFSDSNAAYVAGVVGAFPGLRRIVDLGCGPGDIAVRLATALPPAHITAVDGSAAMLALARRAVEAADVGRQITLVQGRLPGVLLAAPFDAVLSKDMLHHLPDPQVLWSEVCRLGGPGAAVCVADLLRPDSPEEARAIVERVSGGEDPILKEDFYNSLCAAFTVEEVRVQLEAADLPLTVERLTERHMRIRGRLPG
jgi:ubiquinone/menaquinone biosynthesis C-methylase UbiE